MARRIGAEKTTGGGEGEPLVRARRRSVLTFVLLFFALTLVLDAIAGERGWIANRRDSRQLEQGEQELEAKRRENANLQDRLTRLQAQDPATIEEIARREFGFIRPGEKVFVIRDVPKATK